MKLSYLAITFLDIWQREKKTYTHVSTCTQMSVAALIIIAKILETIKYPSSVGIVVYPQIEIFSSVQLSSVAQSCPTLCDPMNRSTPDLPVHHQLLEFTQTHVHWVGDAIQPSHPRSSLSSTAPTPPSIRVFSNESTLRMRRPKYWSFSFSIIPSKEIPGWSPSEWTGWISLQSKGLSRVFSNTTVQKHQFFGAQPSSQSSSHIHTWPLEKP